MTSNAPLIRRAIVCGHGEFARGIISAVDQITGRGDLFIAVSNHGLSGSDLELRLRDLVSANSAVVIFTDLPAGSSTIAARRLMQSVPGVVLVTGANLAALLDYVFNDTMTPANAARQAAERGRAALIPVTGD